MARVKSERELKWEKEHEKEITESLIIMKEIMKKELSDKKKLKLKDEQKQQQ